jgi:CheY-like chemotaxis protein
MTTLQREDTVLIVDDNLDSCASLAMLVMLEGYNAVTAANGLEALEYLRRHGPPRFIILDMMMPVMDGWQFLACKHELAEFAAIPVFVATGREGMLDLDDFPDIVCVAHKPVAPEKLVDTLKRYVPPH